MTPRDAATRLRWDTVGDGDTQARLFPDPAERATHPEFSGMEFLHVRAKRLINKIPSAANLPFDFTINVYRGCSHACTYCFARPTHEYLNLNAGEDFERVIVVKVNAVQALRRELQPGRWGGEHIAMGTNTDPYQRCEGRYRLTRGVVETLTTAANPFSILTKSPLVLRDLDVLQEANERTDVTVNFSIGTLDTDVWRMSEPGAPHPHRRLEALAELNEAGIPSGVLVAPVLPGISDSAEQLAEVVAACVDAGARIISPIALHLRPGVREQFLPWLEDVRPDLIRRYARMYSSAYAPGHVRAKIARTVRELVDRLGGPGGPGANAHGSNTREEHRSQSADGGHTASSQLSLPIE